MKQFSHSKLAMYERCPLNYKLRYLTNLKAEFESTADAFTGSQVHGALELLYRKLLKGRLYTLEELIKHYEDSWVTEWSDKIIIHDKELKQENYIEAGKKCIANYYKQYNPFDNDQTLGIEKKISLQWGEYEIIGYIDRVSREGENVCVIHDYKTNQSMMEQKYADSDRQLALYAMWAKEQFKAREVKMVWHFVRFGEDVVSIRTDGQFARLKKDTLELIADINRAEDEDDFPAIENMCDWCGFWPYCPKKKHLYKTEKLPENEYLKEGGVILAKKYIELAEKKSAINKKARTEGAVITAEILKVRDAILKRAEEEDVEVFDGGEKVVAVNKKTGYAVPTKSGNPEAYVELEELLIETNYWQEVSSVNSTKLNEILDDDMVDDEMKEKIIKLAPLDTGISLSVRKK